ncbi:hypothetical protein Ancab_021373 [Ancistrocladus abbreviatus]
MGEEEVAEAMKPSFPSGRIKKIVKLDKDVIKLTSEALLLISCSTELFLEFLAHRSAEVAAEKKRKTLKIDHLRIAVKRHQPTRDFLIDSLPQSSQPSDRPVNNRPPHQALKDKPAPANTRRIDSFFLKAESGGPSGVNDELENGSPSGGNDSGNGEPGCVNELDKEALDCTNDSENGAPRGVNESEKGSPICVDESENGDPS